MCALRKVLLSGGHRDGDDIYCYASNDANAFCQRCVEATLDEGTGDLLSAGLVLESLIDAEDRCPDCHSVRQRLVRIRFFIPSRKEQFRVLYLRSYRIVSKIRWISRKIPQP